LQRRGGRQASTSLRNQEEKDYAEKKSFPAKRTRARKISHIRDEELAISKLPTSNECMKKEAMKPKRKTPQNQPKKGAKRK